jgi:hypothetical protein
MNKFGDSYDGEFKDGMMNGSGIYTYKNGDVYEGMAASVRVCPVSSRL